MSNRHPLKNAWPFYSFGKLKELVGARYSLMTKLRYKQPGSWHSKQVIKWYCAFVSCRNCRYQRNCVLTKVTFKDLKLSSLGTWDFRNETF